MDKKFYVNVPALSSYSTFLKKCMNEIKQQTSTVANENRRYQLLLKDKISVQVGNHISKLNKIFDDFSNDVDKMSKNVKRDYELYQSYLKDLK